MSQTTNESVLEAKYNQRYLTLKHLQDVRLETLWQTVNETLSRLKQILDDELIETMKQNSVTREFIWQRIVEVFNENVQGDRELFIQKLSEQYAALKGEVVKLEKLMEIQNQNFEQSNLYIQELQGILNQSQQTIFNQSIDSTKIDQLQQQNQSLSQELNQYQKHASSISNDNDILRENYLLLSQEITHLTQSRCTHINQYLNQQVLSLNEKLYQLQSTIKFKLKSVIDSLRNQHKLKQKKCQQYKQCYLKLCKEKELQQANEEQAIVQLNQKHIMQLENQEQQLKEKHLQALSSQQQLFEKELNQQQIVFQTSLKQLDEQLQFLLSEKQQFLTHNDQEAIQYQEQNRENQGKIYQLEICKKQLQQLNLELSDENSKKSTKLEAKRQKCQQYKQSLKKANEEKDYLAQQMKTILNQIQAVDKEQRVKMERLQEKHIEQLNKQQQLFQKELGQQQMICQQSLRELEEQLQILMDGKKQNNEAEIQNLESKLLQYGEQNQKILMESESFRNQIVALKKAQDGLNHQIMLEQEGFSQQKSLLQREITKCQDQNVDLQTRMSEYQQKIKEKETQLNREIEKSQKFEEQIRLKQLEIERLRRQITHYEEQINDPTNEIQLRKYSEINESLLIESNNYKTQIKNLQNCLHQEKESHKKSMASHKEALEQQNVWMHAEFKKNEDQSVVYQNKIIEYQQQLSSKQSQHNIEVQKSQSLEDQLKMAKRKIEEQKVTLDRMDEQIQDYEQQVNYQFQEMKLKDQLCASTNEFNDKLQQLPDENKRLRSEIEQKNREIDQLECDKLTLQKTYNQIYTKLKNQLTELQQEMRGYQEETIGKIDLIQQQYDKNRTEEITQIELSFQYNLSQCQGEIKRLECLNREAKEVQLRQMFQYKRDTQMLRDRMVIMGEEKEKSEVEIQRLLEMKEDQHFEIVQLQEQLEGQKIQYQQNLEMIENQLNHQKSCKSERSDNSKLVRQIQQLKSLKQFIDTSLSPKSFISTRSQRNTQNSHVSTTITPIRKF